MAQPRTELDRLLGSSDIGFPTDLDVAQTLVFVPQEFSDFGGQKFDRGPCALRKAWFMSMLRRRRKHDSTLEHNFGKFSAEKFGKTRFWD